MKNQNSEAPERVVIVGAGHGGATAAALLRQYGYNNDVVLIGRESWLPYQRPPLSKGMDESVICPELIHQAEFYEHERIEVRATTEVQRIDIATKSIEVNGSESITYDVLILAMGSHARRLVLPGTELDGILTLRNFDDASEFGSRLKTGSRLVVVGAGYIGLEAAAVARSRDVAVTVVERENRVLSRSASPQLAAWLERYHRDRGVEFLMGAGVVAFNSDSDGRGVASVELDDGRTLDCDVVLVGAGGVPEDKVASEAGLAVDDGVIVDKSAMTSVPDVYAIGDMARRSAAERLPLSRLESIHNATEQARQAVSHILRRPVNAPEVPWFWSDQFDLKLKLAGFAQRSVQVIERAASGTNSCAWFHLDSDGALVAVETINDGRALMAGKKWIGQEQNPDPAILADPHAKLADAVTA
jgi:3-phenylpropionate/trans-cinnamate dioxygenase ferredoxin reductase subunit